MSEYVIRFVSIIYPDFQSGIARLEIREESEVLSDRPEGVSQTWKLLQKPSDVPFCQPFQQTAGRVFTAEDVW